MLSELRLNKKKMFRTRRWMTGFEREREAKGEREREESETVK